MLSGEPWRLRLLGPRHGSWWQDIPAGGKEAVLTAQRAERNELVLLDSEDEVLSRATLTVLSAAFERSEVLAQLRADERGRILLEGLPDIAKLSWVANEPDHAPATMTVFPSSLPAQWVLRPGGKIHGRFVDASGVPIPGIAVRADGWIEGSSATVARSSVSDSEGEWALLRLPHGKVGLATVSSDVAPFQTVVEVGSTPADLGSIRLEPSVAIRVLVSDDEGTPVKSASLAAGPGVEATTDQRGAALLEGASATQLLRIVARAEGHLVTEVALTPPFEKEQRLVLRRAFVAQGQFVDSAGIPVQSGFVRAETGRRYKDHELQPGGRFTLDLAPATSVRLTLRSPLTQELVVSVKPGLGGERRDLGELRAPTGVQVSGRLVRASDASPVVGARLWAPRPSEQGELVAWAQGDLLEARSQADGSFDLPSLPRRPVLLRFEASGLARLHVAIDPEPDRERIDLGELIMSAGAEVRILAEKEGAEARVDLRNDWLELDMLTARVADGEAVLPHVPHGPATITVLQDRELICEQQVHVGERDDSVEVDCQRQGMRVSGTVTTGGELAGPGMLSWLPEEAGRVPGIILNRQTPLGARQQRSFGAGRSQVDVEVDASGYFETDRLRPGAWGVIWIAETEGPTAPEAIELAEAEEHDLSLEFNPLGLSGLVVDRDQQPVAGARVRDLASDAVAISRSDGRFRLIGLDPGAHQIHAHHGPQSSAVVDAVVEPERETAPLILELAERADERIEIVVEGRSGEGVPGALVFFESDDHEGRILTTDDRGRAVASLRPPLPGWIRAAQVSDGRWTFGSWVDTEQAADGVVLSAQETGSVRIASQELQGVPVIRSEDGWDLSWLLTRIGSRPRVSPELPLEIRGLPTGRYTVELGDFQTALAIRRGDLASVEIP